MYGRGYGGGGGLGFGPPVTPQIIKQLLIANLAVFMISTLYPTLAMWGAATPQLFWEQGFIWQPFTYMWLHAGIGHIAMNMFALWMFGSPLAMVWGAKRFLRFYLVCGTGAGLIILTIPYVLVGFGAGSNLSLVIPTLGASGAVYGVLLGYSLTWPNRTIMLIFPPVAFRAIWLIPLLFFMELYLGGHGNISHVGHLGGVLVAWIWLRRAGTAGGIGQGFNRLKYQFHRWRMRRRLRAVRREDENARNRWDDRTLH